VVTYREINGILAPLAILLLIGEVFVRRRFLGD
jgi:hypothetical protein